MAGVARVQAATTPARAGVAPAVRSISDRREAIAEAVSWGRAGDVLVIAGKGHEQGQEFQGGHKLPFDDVSVAHEILRGAPVNAGDGDR